MVGYLAFIRRPYPGLCNVLANGLACHIQISVFLLSSSLNAPVKLEKLRLSRILYILGSFFMILGFSACKT
jgi:hypothetical protein